MKNTLRFSHPRIRLASALLLCGLLCACVDHSSPGAAAGAPAANTLSAAEAGGGVATTATPAVPAAVLVSSPATYDADFSGSARDYMAARALPATVDLKEAIAVRVAENKGLGDCRPSANRNEAYLVDIDGDGEQEGLALYTLEQCGGPQYETRILSILRQDERGAWVPLSETALSVLASSKRAIISIGDGKVTLAGEDDGAGGTTPPDVIDIPAKTTHQGASE